jgi:hypothetical protein
MPNGRCRLHGGLSTGPRTEAGRAAVRDANTKHGQFGEEGRAFNRAVADLLRAGRADLAAWKAARRARQQDGASQQDGATQRARARQPDGGT